MTEHPSSTLKRLAKENSIDDVKCAELAILLDKKDVLRKYRDSFHYPKMKTLPRGLFFQCFINHRKRLLLL